MAVNKIGESWEHTIAFYLEQLTPINGSWLQAIAEALANLPVPVPTPATQVFFDQNTPTTPGVVFDPDIQATQDILYVSSTNSSTWIYNGTAYITYAPTIVTNTPFNLLGTTFDAGGNKTASVERFGSIYTTGADSYFNGVRIGKGASNIAFNTSVGFEVLNSNTTGARLTAVGYQALKINTSGSNNTAFGAYTLYQNSVGVDNSAFGTYSLSSVTSGNYNSSFGRNSLGSLTLGNFNSALGVESLYGATGAVSGNTALGYRAGAFLANGSTQNSTPQQSIFIGYNTKALTVNDTNQTVIGYDVTGKGSNTVQIGNASVTDTYLQGAVTFNNAYKFPTTDGTADYVLKTNGAGVLSWAIGSSSGKVGIANSSGVYTYYATLSAAITAATSGQTVDLLTDITETGSVTITLKAGVKINGNGYTYTLNVNDNTHAITQAGGGSCEMYNLKVVRTGRANNSGGAVIYKNDTGNLFTLKCQNVVFENTYGSAVVLYYSAIYGLTVNSYGTGIDTGNSAGYIYNCIVASSAGIGIYNNDTSEIANCNVTSVTGGISSTFASVYNTRATATTGIGISAIRVVNSTGLSSTNVGIATNNGNNCVGISTTGAGLSGVFKNSTGISTSGYGGSGSFYTCSLISSSNYALQSGGTVYLYNSYAESTSSPVTARANIYNSTVRCFWNNAGGSCTNSFVVGSHEVVNSHLEVTNASAYCITGYVGSTWKYTNNSFKGATIPVNTTNIAQGITNTSDSQGNILI